jgi:hypothetical protein
MKLGQQRGGKVPDNNLITPPVQASMYRFHIAIDMTEQRRHMQ